MSNPKPTDIPKIIGQGSYGCVYDPSLTCKGNPTNVNYTNKVSKLLTTKHANTELEEFVIVSQIDPNNEFHLESPTICSAGTTTSDIQSMAKCKPVAEKDPNNLSLLILANGGSDLAQFCPKTSSYFKQPEKMDKFLLEIHTLLRGLKAFSDHGLVHFDLKPQNILFNTKTGKLRYIDFGLMTTKKELMETSANNTNSRAQFHWSYPLEVGFMNKRIYNKYKLSTPAVKHNIKQHIMKAITNNPLGTPMDLRLSPMMSLFINKPLAFNIMYSYLQPTLDVPDKTIVQGYITEAMDGFTRMQQGPPYEKVLEHIINSIDVYGLGFSLQFIINCFYKHNCITKSTLDILSPLFTDMWTFDPIARVTYIEDLLDEYEDILKQLGVLQRLNVQFTIDNKVTSVPAGKSIGLPPRHPPPVVDLTQPVVDLTQDSDSDNDAAKIIATNPKKKRPTPVVPSTHKSATPQPLDSLAVSSSIKKPIPDSLAVSSSIKKPIPDSLAVSSSIKKPNPDSLAVYKQHLQNSEVSSSSGDSSNNLDWQFPSVQQPHTYIDSLANKPLSAKLVEYATFDPNVTLNTVRICPDDKEFNPNTKRCVAKCKPNFIRDANFKCVSVTPKRKITIPKITVPKVCPPNKEMNPFTRKCVNKCKTGFKRDNKFKCVRNTTQKQRTSVRSVRSVTPPFTDDFVA